MRSTVELGILLALMLVLGTGYTLANAGSKRHVKFFSSLRPEGIQCPGNGKAGTQSQRALDTSKPDPAADPKVDSRFRFVDHDVVLGHFREGDALFVDARRTEEYQQGHIVGAVSVPFWEEDAALARMERLKAEVPNERPIIVYCTRAKDCEDSQEVAIQLHSRGFVDLMVYRGGYPEWVEKHAGDEFIATGAEAGDK